MGKVTFDMAMSLDGFIAGPNMRPGAGLGDEGDRLHQWMFETKGFKEAHGESGGTEGSDSDVIAESLASAAVYVMGRRMFGGDGPWDNPEWGDEPWEGWWGDEPPYHKPVFVLTHHPREPLVKGETTFTFVTDGIESALDRARDAAGDGEISIAGGAAVVQQYLKAGLIDEFQLHISPLLLRKGVRLFAEGDEPRELELIRTIASPAVTHLRYRVLQRAIPAAQP
jgi:dihydrofolate reductase